MGPGSEGIVIPIAHLKFVVFARQLSQPGATRFRPSRPTTNPQTTHIPTKSRRYPKYWVPGGEVSRALSLPTRSSNDRGLDLDSTHTISSAREKGLPGHSDQLTGIQIFRDSDDWSLVSLRGIRKLRGLDWPLIWYNKTRPRGSGICTIWICRGQLSQMRASGTS